MPASGSKIRCCDATVALGPPGSANFENDDVQSLLRSDNPQLACPRKRLYNGGRAIRSLANRRMFMSQLIQTLTDNFVVLAAALIALGLGWFSINYLSKRRQMLHQERMASLVKGLHYAGVAKDIFSKPPAPKTDARTHALRGLRWLFGGAGLSGALYASASMPPYVDPASATHAALAGIIPGAIGLAHLLFSFLCRNRQQQPTLLSAVSRNRQRPNFLTRTSYR
jgi:hypothetical protein